jgi:hypothetical protein
MLNNIINTATTSTPAKSEDGDDLHLKNFHYTQRARLLFFVYTRSDVTNFISSVVLMVMVK